MTAFIDFGRKTQYSLKNAMGDTKSMIDKLKEIGQKYFAISDYGEVSGWVQQYFTCKKNDIVPILGMETFVNNYRFKTEENETFVTKMNVSETWTKNTKQISDDELDWSQIDFPIDIFALTLEGYTNIIKIHNDAQINGVDKRPRTTDLFLSQNGKGIIALMPTPYSEISSHIYNGNHQMALNKYNFYQKIFDEVYVEIPIIEDEDYREINASTIKFCLKNNIPMIPVINAHYNDKEDKDVFPIFQKCGALRGGLYYEVDYAPNMYAKTAEEVWDTFKKFHESEIFTEQLMRELFFNLNHLCNKFKTLEIDTTPKTPHFENSNEQLRKHALAGFKKYGFDKKGEVYKKRLEYELDNICRAGFADYFLLIEQMFDWHVNKMGRTGSVGRGSAAGSLVLRCIGATKIDPIEHNLLFERFLDASRLDEIINQGGQLSGADFPDVDCFNAEETHVCEEKKGITLIKNIEIGDKVLTRNNTYQKVEKIADFYDIDTLRICYGDWYFDCTPNHELLINRDNKIEYKYAHELIPGKDQLVINENKFIPVIAICNNKQTDWVRDLKIENQHCYKVFGKAYNKVIIDDKISYLSDKELIQQNYN